MDHLFLDFLHMTETKPRFGLEGTRPLVSKLPRKKQALTLSY
jgi:hypothetical protein